MLYALLNRKLDGSAEFGNPSARFEGDDPVEALRKHIRTEEFDPDKWLEESFESFGEPYTYVGLMAMETGTFTILKVSADPGTKEFDVAVAEMT